MNVAIGTGLALVAIIGACLFVLWYGSAVLIDQLEDRIEVLERNWAEQFEAPVEDDSSEAMESGYEAESASPEAAEQDAHNSPISDDTDEFPAIPATEPDGIAIQVQTALIDQRPSPVPRETEWTERTFNIGGTLQTYRIPAKREEAS